MLRNLLLVMSVSPNQLTNRKHYVLVIAQAYDSENGQLKDIHLTIFDDETINLGGFGRFSGSLDNVGWNNRIKEIDFYKSSHYDGINLNDINHLTLQKIFPRKTVNLNSTVKAKLQYIEPYSNIVNNGGPVVVSGNVYLIWY